MRVLIGQALAEKSIGICCFANGTFLDRWDHQPGSKSGNQLSQGIAATMKTRRLPELPFHECWVLRPRNLDPLLRLGINQCHIQAHIPHEVRA